MISIFFITTRYCLYCKCEWVVIVQTLFYCQHHVTSFFEVFRVWAKTVLEEGKIMKHVNNNYIYMTRRTVIVVSLLIMPLILYGEKNFYIQKRSINSFFVRCLWSFFLLLQELFLNKQKDFIKWIPKMWSFS